MTTTQALTNYFLLQNKDVKVLHIDNMGNMGGFYGKETDIFYRSDHIVVKTVRKTNPKSEEVNMSLLQEIPPSKTNAVEVDYGRQFVLKTGKFRTMNF